MHHRINSPSMVMQFKGHQSTTSPFGFKSASRNQEHAVLGNNFSGPSLVDMFDPPILRQQNYGHVRRGRSMGRGWRGRNVPPEAQHGAHIRSPLDADTYLGSPNYTMKTESWKSNNNTTSGHIVPGSTYYHQPIGDQHWRGVPEKSEHCQFKSREKSPQKLSQNSHKKPHQQQHRGQSKQTHRQYHRNYQQCLPEIMYGGHYIIQARGNGHKWPFNPMQQHPHFKRPLDSPFSHLLYLNEGQGFPKKLLTGGDWDELSEGVWQKFTLRRQTFQTYVEKTEFFEVVVAFLKCAAPEYDIFLVGSTMTGFGSNDSDVDMCLVVEESYTDPRSAALHHLDRVMHILQESEVMFCPTMIQAKVPILKFRDFQKGFEIDLNCNNVVGIRNTHLLFSYTRLDWRVQPLVMVVKLWARAHNINDAKNMTISSYSLTLMVIHFLQCGVSPPVLPCLHSMCEGKFSPDSDISHIETHENCNYKFQSDNDQPLGELLYSFLEYYVNFDYDQFAISVRLGTKVPVDECRQNQYDAHQWKNLCIEEPFDLSNTARSVYDPDVFRLVRSVFANSLERLQKTRCVDHIFPAAKSG